MLVPLSTLSSAPIIRWLGHEMALDGGEPLMPDATGSAEGGGMSPVVWEHPDIPFWQFNALDIELASGRCYKLVAQMDDGSGFHGLQLMALDGLSPPDADEEHGIFRSRPLRGFPTGQGRIDVIRQEGPNAIQELTLTVGDQVIRLVAAEVHPQWDGSLSIVDGDESILVQVNGMRPVEQSHVSLVRVLDGLLERWRLEEAEPLPPESPESIRAAFAASGGVATADVIALYGCIGGFWSTDKEMWRLWPLNEIPGAAAVAERRFVF